MVTIADIAKLAGVAKSTVSRYLNGGSVSEATVKKIEKVINATNYTPNTFAQSLKAKKTNIIGVIVPRLNSFATSHTLIGIDERLKEENFYMLISNTSQDLQREIDSIYELARQKVSGIVLLATEITSAHLEAFNQIKLPFLFVGQEHVDYHSVIHHDYKAAYELGEYIIKKKHKKIAFLGVTDKDIAVGVKRKEGFYQALKESGEKNIEVEYFETTFDMTKASEIANLIINQYDPSIIVCATDNIALGVLKTAYVNKLDVPKKLSITGFGGYDITEIIHPSITTVKFDYKKAGQMAAKNIIKLVNGEEVVKRTYSDYKLIERESVDDKD